MPLKSSVELQVMIPGRQQTLHLHHEFRQQMHWTEKEIGMSPQLSVQFKRQLDSLSKQTSCHPKMMALQTAVLDHFGLGESDISPETSKQQTGKDMCPGRIIIFSSYRESVTEILAMLAKHEPSVRARYNEHFMYGNLYMQLRLGHDILLLRDAKRQAFCSEAQCSLDAATYWMSRFLGMSI